MVSFGQNLKMPKTCEKPFYRNSRVVLCKKRLEKKKNKYWRNEIILKIGHLAKAIAHENPIAFAKWSVWVKIKNAKNMQKTILQEQQNCSVKKTAPKNTKYWRNKIILKIAHPAKAIAHAKAIAFA